VEVDGKLTAKQDPSNYLIKLLGLNRPSRVVVRKNRLLQRRVDELTILAEVIEEIIEVGEMTKVSWDKLKSARAMISSVRQLRLDIAAM
jgi:hypothetical protein